MLWVKLWAPVSLSVNKAKWHRHTHWSASPGRMLKPCTYSNWWNSVNYEVLYYKFHSPDENTEANMLTDLPQVTQLVGHNPVIWILATWLQSPWPRPRLILKEEKLWIPKSSGRHSSTGVIPRLSACEKDIKAPPGHNRSIIGDCFGLKIDHSFTHFANICLTI